MARPIGAFVLGHWGDTHGRKNVLVLCMLLIGGSTFCVALLPTYDTVGIWAPILLVILRLIQGFAVGGEISGASAMILEHSPFGRRGYYASFTLQGVQAGQIFAAAVFLPLSAIMPKDAFQSLGLADPVPAQRVRRARRLHDPTQGRRDPGVRGGGRGTARCRRRRSCSAFKENGSDMLRVICMALMNAIPTAVTVFGATFATNAAYGVGFTATNYLWISVVRQHRRRHPDPVRRKPVGQDRPPAGDHRRLPRLRHAGLPLPVLREPGQPRHGVLLRHADVGRRLPGLQRGVPVVLPGAVPDQDPGDRVRGRRRTSAP